MRREPFHSDTSQVTWVYVSFVLSLIVSLFALLSPKQSSAQADGAPPKEVIYSLQELIESSLKSHPGVKARRFEIEAAQRGLLAAKGMFDLQLNGDLDLMDDLVTIPNPLEMGARTPIGTQRYSAELRLSQPLRWGTILGFGLRQSQIETTNPFRNCVPGIISDRCFESTLTLTLNQPLMRGRSAAANTSEEMNANVVIDGAKAQLRLELTRQVQAIAQFYVQLSLAQTQYHLEQEQLTLTERRLQEAKERLKLGLVAESDLYPLEAALAQREQGVMAALGRVEDVQAQLKALSGLKVERVRFPQLWLEDDRLMALTPELTSAQLEANPQVSVLRATTQQLEVRREPLRDAERSQLNLGLVWSQSGLGEALGDALDALPNNESRYYGVTLRYTQALSDRAEHQSAQLEAQLRASALDREALLRDLRLQWERQVTQIHRNRRLLSLATAAQTATARNHEAASAKLNEGRATLFEVLELQNQSLASQTQRLAIEHEIAQALLELWAINGELLDRFGLALQ